MPVSETMIDQLAHLMHHFFTDHPEADDVEADVLAHYAMTHGFCPDCAARFVATAGVATFAEAIDRVWGSALWGAFRARLEAQEET
jgi:hypothetical protein